MASHRPPTARALASSTRRPGGDALPLSRLEVASGLALGLDPDRGELPDSRGDARDALAQAMLPALERTPCVVSFSGGLDSSAVLAVAVRTARSHALPEPVPVTLRFPGRGNTEESRWQELVVSHLRLREWERLQLDDELDFLGPLARRGLVEHGLLWPANAHFHVPVFEHARGGSVLTGVDGDGLFGTWRWARARAATSGTSPREPRDLARVALALAPAALRSTILGVRLKLVPTWLRPWPRLRIRAAVARSAAGEPWEWERRLRWYPRQRYLRLGVHSLGLLGEAHEVQVVHPLMDRSFLGALATLGGSTGLGSRERIMRALFADLLPPALLIRKSKAEFGAAMWGPEARGFAAGWDGTGVDPEFVDRRALREAWSGANPPLASATLMQAAWLESAVASSAPVAEPST